MLTGGRGFWELGGVGVYGDGVLLYFCRGAGYV